MNRLLINALCLTAIVCSSEIYAQNFPLGALPAWYNGGFAGEAGELRVASYSFFEKGNISYASSWYGSQILSGGSYVSIDKFLKKIHSGIAFTAGYRGIKDYHMTRSASLTVSPKFSFKGKYTFAPFVD